MYVSKTPAVVKALYGSLVWNMPSDTKKVYITFDDGPHPQITPEVLTILESYNAKATFFCIGKNISQNRILFEELSLRGHAVGNHTYDHLNGWKTDDYAYFRNVIKCQHFTKTNLFRPPYGRISRSQSQVIGKKFKIIMWDVLSADFDKTITRDKCCDNVLKNTGAGSVVVFHDSEKAADKMLYALPRLLDLCHEKGLECVALPT